MIIKSIQIESTTFGKCKELKIFTLYPDITTVKTLCSFLINSINMDYILFTIYYSRRHEIDQLTK